MIRNAKLLKFINIKPKTIIHIGASKGQDRAQYMILGAKYIYWGEAFQPLVNLLQENFPRDHVIWGAFTNINTGHKTLHVSPSGTIGSRKLNVHHSNFNSPNKTLDQEFLNLNLVKPIMLVIDTDGAEIEVLEGGREFIKEVQWLILEQYWTWDNGQWHINLTNLAKEYGFRRVFGRISYSKDYEDVLYTKSGLARTLYLKIVDKIFYGTKQLKHLLFAGHTSSTYFHCFKCEK
jgi:FkbM family methyltransferase